MLGPLNYKLRLVYIYKSIFQYLSQKPKAEDHKVHVWWPNHLDKLRANILVVFNHESEEKNNDNKIVYSYACYDTILSYVILRENIQ